MLPRARNNGAGLRDLHGNIDTETMLGSGHILLLQRKGTSQEGKVGREEMEEWGCWR